MMEYMKCDSRRTDKMLCEQEEEISFLKGLRGGEGGMGAEPEIWVRMGCDVTLAVGFYQGHTQETGNPN